MAAPEVPIKGANASVKLRNPVTTALLEFFTLGIYGLFWYYYVNREMADLGRARGSSELGDNPTNSLLALIPGGFVIVPAVISLWNACKRLQAAQRVAGTPEPQVANNVVAFILLLVFAPAGAWFFQTELNKVWASETEGGAAQLPGQAAAPAAGQQAASAQPAEQQQAPPPAQ